MNYKIHTIENDGTVIYVRIDDDGEIRHSCTSRDPVLIEWLAEGNEPLPADEPS